MGMGKFDAERAARTLHANLLVQTATPTFELIVLQVRGWMGMSGDVVGLAEDGER